jgi:chromosome segregation ATPase
MSPPPKQNPTGAWAGHLHDQAERIRELEAELQASQEAADDYERMWRKSTEREKALLEALDDQRRRWNRHSTRLTMAGVNASGRDMDDAVDAIAEALAAHDPPQEAGDVD